jgi:hypothetical protein
MFRVKERKRLLFLSSGDPLCMLGFSAEHHYDCITGVAGMNGIAGNIVSIIGLQRRGTRCIFLYLL